jgi:hypothetical protein
VTRRRLSATAVLLALAASAAAALALARPDGSPFYAVPPSPRKECHNVNHCLSVIGPWVVAPSSGQASWLLVCPKRRGYVGGTDTRASSAAVRVWFEGQIGSPVKQSVTTGAFLLFHGVTTNRRAGSFQPTVGCIKLLHHTTGRSTVSARQAGPLPGTNAGQPLDLYAKTVVLTAGTVQRRTATCAKGERLVESWAQLAFGSQDPPPLRSIGRVRIRTVESRDSVTAVIQTASSLPFVPLAEVQVGAKCTT